MFLRGFSMLRTLLAITGASVALLSAAPASAQQSSGELPAGLQQDYDPAPALWRLADEDTTIYLFGTVHMLPDGFRWRNPQLDRIIAEVDELVLESSDSDADASLAFSSNKLVSLMLDRTPTSEQLSPLARPKWRQLIALSGQPFDEVDRMPLMVALMGFGMAGDDNGPSSYEHGVETVLEQEFMESGRPISSIEDTGRVMLSLYRISDDLILSDLEDDLIRWDGRGGESFFGSAPEADDAQDWELEHGWARGEVQQDMDFGIANAKLARSFYRALLTNRNRRWSVWLDNRLDEPGTILVAVGAGHFEGAESVLEMLRARGLEAERINTPVR